MGCEKAADTLSHKVVALQELVSNATHHRDELQRQLRAVQEENDRASDPSIPSSNLDIKQLLAQSEEQKDELAVLQQEMSLQHEREMAMLRKKIQQLSGE